MTDISTALKKAGWTEKEGGVTSTARTIVVYGEKGEKKAKVTLIKPLNGRTILAGRY